MHCNHCLLVCTPYPCQNPVRLTKLLARIRLRPSRMAEGSHHSDGNSRGAVRTEIASASGAVYLFIYLIETPIEFCQNSEETPINPPRCAPHFTLPHTRPTKVTKPLEMKLRLNSADRRSVDGVVGHNSDEAPVTPVGRSGLCGASRPEDAGRAPRSCTTVRPDSSTGTSRKNSREKPSPKNMNMGVWF